MSKDSMPNKVEQGLYTLLDNAGKKGVTKSQWDDLGKDLMRGENIKKDVAIRADMQKKYLDSIWTKTLGKHIAGYSINDVKVKQVQVYLDSSADKGKRAVLTIHSTISQMQRAANYRVREAAKIGERAATGVQQVDTIADRADGDYQQLAFQFFDKDEEVPVALEVVD